MPRLLSEPIKVNHALEAALGLKCEISNEIYGISDSNIGGENTITEYIKGKLPKKGTILISQNLIDGYNCVISKDPGVDMMKLIQWLKLNIGFQNLTSGKIHESVSLGKNVVIENDVEIGEGCIIEHNVVIHAGTKIGKKCIIRSGSVIGGQGYGFVKDTEGNNYRQFFLGGVIFEDNVEIGYNCCIVNGTVENTILSAGVKLDNLVHIAHDCNIGENSTITAGVSFCGYVNVGAEVRMAPNSTVLQRLSIGENSLIGLGAVVLKDVEPGSTIIGNPGRNLKNKNKG